jgi:DnaJ family protein C protein 17
MDVDYYAVLGVEFGATEKEIRKAFRIKSLTCHPDKVGPEDIKAQELFQLINIAVDTLTDPEKRKNYDDLHKAEQLRKKRFEEMNKERQYDKTRLEEREREAKRAKMEEYSPEIRDKLNIERIKEEAQRKMKARQELRRQEVLANVAIANSIRESKSLIENAAVEDCTIKVKWPKTEQMDEVRIRNTFSKYGSIDIVMMSKSGKRLARVVFKHVRSAFQACQNPLEPFKVEPILEPEPPTFAYIRNNSAALPDFVGRSTALNRGSEYESITLQKLKEKQQSKHTPEHISSM